MPVQVMVIRDDSPPNRGFSGPERIRIKDAFANTLNNVSADERKKHFGLHSCTIVEVPAQQQHPAFRADVTVNQIDNTANGGVTYRVAVVKPH
jgi:hypothetical protein